MVVCDAPRQGAILVQGSWSNQLTLWPCTLLPRQLEGILDVHVASCNKVCPFTHFRHLLFVLPLLLEST